MVVGFWTMYCCSCASGGERNLIGQRTESDWTADGIRLDGGRNPIGRRTESDRAADANGAKSREITTNKDCKYETFLITLQTKTETLA